MFDQFKAEITDFTYDAPTDTYTCAAGKALPFRKYDTTTDGNWSKIYWATCRDYQQCPLKPAYVSGAERKQLTRTLTPPTAGRGSANKAGGGNACGGSDRARSNPSLATCCITTACAG